MGFHNFLVYVEVVKMDIIAQIQKHDFVPDIRSYPFHLYYSALVSVWSKMLHQQLENLVFSHMDTTALQYLSP